MDAALTVIALMIFGTLLLSWNDIQRKRALTRGISDTHLLVGSFVGSGTLFAIVALLFPAPVQDGFWRAALASIVLNCIAQQLFFRAMKLQDASLITPLRLLSAPLVVITGYFFLAEVPSLFGALGIALTILGIWLLLFPDFRPRSLDRGVVLGLLAAVVFAISFPLDKQATLASSVACAGAVIMLGTGILTFLIHQLQRRTFANELLSSVQLESKTYLALSLTFGAGVYLTNAAFLYTLAAYVASLKRLQAVWTVLLAGFILKERDTARRLLAVGIMLAGVIGTVVAG